MPIRSVTHRIPLQLRQLRQGVVLVRASNETGVDEYGTTNTVEALMSNAKNALKEARKPCREVRNRLKREGRL